MSRLIAIGDIHGCIQTFNALLEDLVLNKNDHLVLLGDYINKGPDSKGVLDKIIALNQSGYQITSLMGNHEYDLLECFRKNKSPKTYTYRKHILENFKIKKISRLDTKYVDLLNSMPIIFQKDTYFFVHAGPNMYSIDPLKAHVKMLTIRNWYPSISDSILGDQIIVHGHTPIIVDKMRNMFSKMEKKQYLNLDTGACLSRYSKQGFGRLSAADLTNRILYVQKNLDNKKRTHHHESF